MLGLTKFAPSNREHYESYFYTTHLKNFYYLLASLIIVPTYITSMLHCTRLLYLWLDSTQLQPLLSVISASGTKDLVVALLSWLPHTILILCLFPLVMSLISSRRAYWRTGYTHRMTLMTVCLILNLHLLPDSIFPGLPRLNPIAAEDTVFYAIFVLVIVYAIVVCVVRYRWVTWALLFLVILLAVAYIATLGNIDVLVRFGELTRTLFLLAYAINALAVGIYTLYQFNVDNWSHRIQPPFALNKSKFGAILCCGGIFLLLHLRATNADIGWHWETRRYDVIFVMLIPIMLLAAGDPRLFLSRQISYLRHATSPLRHDTLTSLASPTLEESELLNRARRWIIRHVRLENQAIGIPLALVVGGIGMPLLQLFIDVTRYPRTFTVKLIDLMALGVSSALVLTTLYFVYWLIQHREKYVVLPFKSESSDLDSVATQLMHHLTDEIRQIGLLMQMRQVDNTQSSGGSALAHFVASGQEPEFISQLQNLTNIDDVRRGTFGWLIVWLTNTLAVIKVRGTLRRRLDNGLELWIEINRRYGQVVAVDRVIVASIASGEYDDKLLMRVGREMAIKLVLKLGQNYHLASSWRSLEYFLDGLQAASERNWWRAIEAYRAAIQNEESQRGSFGIGHYHLGATLLSLGELHEALKHLEQAEVSGPPIAETYYTLALAQANANWDALTEERVMFKQIQDNCILALRLRPNFAEAYHLMGALHYQRGKLLEREGTQRFGEQADYRMKMSKRGHWEVNYRRALRYLHTAIRTYDREIDRQMREADRSNGSYAELNRLFQARIMATHLVGDALKSLTYFSEADTYYEDAQQANPSNLRTLVDRAQNYCIAGQWQQADEFVSRQLMTVPEAVWNADANLYAGWAMAGGLDEMSSYSWWVAAIPFLRPLLNILATAGFKRTHEAHLRDMKQILGYAVKHLDLALHQRSRFLTRRLNTDWQYPFNNATRRLLNWGHFPFVDAFANVLFPYIPAWERFRSVASEKILAAASPTEPLEKMIEEARKGLDAIETPLKEAKINVEVMYTAYTTAHTLLSEIQGFSRETPPSQELMSRIELAVAAAQTAHTLCGEVEKSPPDTINKAKEQLAALQDLIQKNKNIPRQWNRWSKLYRVPLAVDGLQTPPVGTLPTWAAVDTQLGLAHRLLNAEMFMLSVLATKWYLENPRAAFYEAQSRIKTFYNKTIYDPNVDIDKPPFVMQMRLWLFWQMHSVDYDDANDPLATLKDSKALKLTIQEIWPDGCQGIYDQFRFHKQQLIMLLDDIKHSGRLHGMSHNWEKQRLAATALDNWKMAVALFKKQPSGQEWTLTFKSRWLFFTHIDLSIFTVRLLTEAWAYETAWYVANEAVQHMERWYADNWGKPFSESQQSTKAAQNNEHFRVSPYRFRHSMATLYALKAYCALQMNDDPETNARMEAYKNRAVFKGESFTAYRDLKEKSLHAAQRDVSQALHLLPRHWIALYVQAHLYKRQNIASEAAAELYRLLQAMSPYDPVDYIANWQINSKPNPETMSILTKTKMPTKTYAFYMEFLAKLYIGDGQENLETTKQKLRDIKAKSDSADSQEAIATIWTNARKQFTDLKDRWQIIKSQISYPEQMAPQTWSQLWLCFSDYETHKQLEQNNSKSLRWRMQWQEVVNGRERFRNIVDRGTIHKDLSDIFFDTPDQQALCMGHLSQAITWTQHRDFEADYLLLYAERLDLLDRFIDAKAVLTMLKNIRYFLEPQTLSIAKTRQVEILEIIMDTRLGRYSSSLKAGEMIWRKWKQQPYNPHLRTPSEIRSENARRRKEEDFDLSERGHDEYRHRLLHPELIEYYDAFLNFIGSYKELSAPYSHLFGQFLRLWKISHPVDTLLKTLSADELPKKVADLHLIAPNQHWQTLAAAWTYLDTERMADLITTLLEQKWVEKGTTVASQNIPYLQAQEQRKKAPYLNIAWLTAGRLADFVTHESLRHLEQIAQLLNNLAYNSIELGLNHNVADHVSHQHKPFRLANAPAVEMAIETGELLIKFAEKAPFSWTERYRFYLRNYYDTKGWMQYLNLDVQADDPIPGLSEKENAALSDLSSADSTFRVNALFYDQESPIVYYHMTRLHLAMAERIWQGLNDKTEAGISEIAPVFQEHLSAAAQSLREARRTDTTQRLKSRFDFLGQRIEKYNQHWEERLLRSLKGAPDKQPKS